MAFVLDDALLTLGGLGLLGGIFGGAGSLMGSAMQSSDAKTLQRRAQRFEAKQAQINRDYMERMSNTAHQREVEDLRSAGLNPILSATGGSGASVPSASTAVSGNMPQAVDWGSSLSNAFSAPLEQALNGISTAVTLKKGLADVDNTKANTDNVNSATALNKVKTEQEKLNLGMKAVDAKYHEDLKTMSAERARQQLEDGRMSLIRNAARTAIEASPEAQAYYLDRLRRESQPGMVEAKVLGSGAKLPAWMVGVSSSAKDFQDYRNSKYSDFYYLTNGHVGGIRRVD